MGRPPKYGLEHSISKFLDRGAKYLFKEGKSDMEKLAMSLELAAFLFLLGAIVLRLGR